MTLCVHGLRSDLFGPVDLEIGRGEVVAIQGPSGAGKTLLLRAIADLDPASGTVTLDDCPRSTVSGPEWRRMVRFVAAEPAWWGEEVGSHFRAPAAAAEAAAGLGLGKDCMAWPVARLSTGEGQRLAFLRAIEDRPQVLLLDEPTAALDQDAETAVEAMLARLAASGTAILLVTHDPLQAARLARRSYEMRDRRLAPVASS